MYLSRLILNPRNRGVRFDLAHPREMHRTLLRAFPPALAPTSFRQQHGVLYRVDVHPRTGVPFVLVQSITDPDWFFLEQRTGYLDRFQEANLSCKPVRHQYQRLAKGQVLAFRLRANATKKKVTREDDGARKPNGQRVPLRKPEEQMAWLSDKGKRGGFELVNVSLDADVPDVRIRPEEDIQAKRHKKNEAGADSTMTFGSSLFDGRLRITDANAFRETLAKGIGSGKAYGFGLLSVAPG